jgi:hypothetical protein
MAATHHDNLYSIIMYFMYTIYTYYWSFTELL